jgi:hypothetical protein
MKTKTKFKVGDRVQLPSGERGEIVSEMPVGEYQIYVKGKGYVFYYPEDLDNQTSPRHPDARGLKYRA